MAQTENTYTQSDTTTVLRSFTFPYINQSDIKVELDGVATTAYSHPNLTQIQLNSAPAVGTVIRIFRQTSDEETPATFYSGSAIRARDLNNNFTQNLYVTQETNNNVASAWKTGNPTIISTETWAGNDTKIATTGAIDGRIDAKIDTALTTDVSGGDGVTIVDNNPGTGQIRVDLDADIATLKDMQSGAATSLAALTSNELQILDGATLTTTELNTLDGITATTTELNYTDGVTSSIQTQLNSLSTGKQPLDTELTELATMSAGTASALADLTQTEVQKIDGLTASTAELNKLDGATASTTEINKLTGLTSSTTELNKLTGLTSSTAELNKLTGVTASTAELNKADGLLATTSELNILDGVTANSSELNKLDGYIGSTNDLNIVSGKSFKNTAAGTLDTTSDTEIPSSKVIAAHVASSQTAIGGFVTIADEVSFPNTQPLAGVVVSINNAAGLVVSGSGASTSAKRVDNTTVTINGFPSSLNGETLAAGVGLVVTSTSTANTYNYHKLLLSETDIKNISDEINDFTSRYRIASSAPTSNNDAGDMYFDTSANKMKVYNGTTSSWDDVASVGNFFINSISSSSGTGGGSATFNGSAYRFTLSNAPVMAQQLIVSVNGVIQKPNAGTSQPSEGFAISSNDIIFAAAPASGSDYFIITQGSSVSIGTPSDNTVTSAKIVDGSILNGDISSTANIAGSKVADDSIPEVKLDIHNAPATDKYLKYTSNGMEWSDGASEGTDVKSTGESGTTKFLRTDGDGTSSWQVPPSYTHPNHSGEVTSSADGAQTIASNVVDEDNLKVDNSPTNDYVLTAKSSAAGGLTWAAVPSGGNSIDLVADGAIAAGKPVIITTAGKAKQAGMELGAKADAPHDQNSALIDDPSTGSDVAYDLIHDPDRDRIIFSSRNPTSGNTRITVLEYSQTIGTDTKSDHGTTDVSTGTGSKDTDMAYDPDTNQIAIVYREGSNGYLKLGTLAANNTISFGSASTWNGSNPENLNVLYDPDNDKIVVVYSENGYIYARVGTVSGTGISSWGTAVNLDWQNNRTEDYELEVVYDTTNNKFIVAYRNIRTNYLNRLYACVFSVSGTTVTWGTPYLVHAYNSHYIKMAFDTELAKALITFRSNNGVNTRGRRMVIYISSGTTLTSNGTVYDYDGEYDVKGHDTCYDPGSKRFFTVGTQSSNSDKAFLCYHWINNSDNSVYTPGNNTTNFASTDVHSDEAINWSVVPLASSGKIVAVGRNSDQGSEPYVYLFETMESTTNLTSKNCIGWANSAINDTATGTINLQGSVATGQSGLTPGQIYFVQNDGTLGSSVVSTQANLLAIASDKGLVQTRTAWT